MTAACSCGLSACRGACIEKKEMKEIKIKIFSKDRFLENDTFTKVLNIDTLPVIYLYLLQQCCTFLLIE